MDLNHQTSLSAGAGRLSTVIINKDVYKLGHTLSILLFEWVIL